MMDHIRELLVEHEKLNPFPTDEGCISANDRYYIVEVPKRTWFGGIYTTYIVYEKTEKGGVCPVGAFEGRAIGIPS